LPFPKNAKEFVLAIKGWHSAYEEYGENEIYFKEVFLENY